MSNFNYSAHRETVLGSEDRNRKGPLPEVTVFQLILHHLVRNGSHENLAVLKDGWVVSPVGYVVVVEELPERRVAVARVKKEAAAFMDMVASSLEERKG